MALSAAVEGLVDETVLRRIVEVSGYELGPVYGKRGKEHLRTQISGYNNAARFSPWLVAVDLNHEEPCAPALCARWLPAPSPHMRFRVAVRAVEAWLLGDRQHLAAYLRVGRARIPADPDAIDNPKHELVNIARHSRSRDIRQDIVPRHGSGRQVGPGYAGRLIQFVTLEDDGWDVAEAALASPSLAGCIAAVHSFPLS